MAAGPSVVVRFLADLTGFSKQAVEAQGTFQNVAGKMSSAFHGVIGSINQTGILGPFGSALDGVGNALDTMPCLTDGVQTVDAISHFMGRERESSYLREAPANPFPSLTWTCHGCLVASQHVCPAV